MCVLSYPAWHNQSLSAVEKQERAVAVVLNLANPLWAF
jgi:hypothetical protein